jgi:phosphonate transport system substrate-binding protein
MKILKFTSCQAEIAEFVVQEVAAYVAERLAMPTALVNNMDWQRREQLFDADEIQVIWICGAPYVWKVDHGAAIELLAAPVMAADRYGGQPVYYSDIVVQRDSRFQTFADLRNASWAYNEPHSHSGYHTVRFHLAQIGERSNYFGTVVESGAHQTTLQWLVDRQIDGSAVDSTVLELACERDPTLHQHLRIIGTLGPSPIPP